MAVDVVIPALGESISEGKISRWMKADGAIVKVDDELFEVESDKASQVIVASDAGSLKIIVQVGETVPIGTKVGSIDPAGKPAASGGASNGIPKPTDPASVSKTAGSAANAPSEIATMFAGPKSSAPGSEPILSPAAARIVAEKHIDPSTVSGTGRGGRIGKEDVAGMPTSSVVASIPARMPASAPMVVSQPSKTGPRETRTKMTTIRARIAERLLFSQQSTASLTTFNEADMTAINELRGKYKDRFKEKHGVGLGFMSFFVKATVEALKTYPNVNARIDGSDIVQQHFYDIGVAVSTEKGLMVPIMRDADTLSFAGVEKKIVEVAGKAKDGKIAISDLQGGTFTITNGGTFGSMMSTPILNPPQSAILGMHAINKRPVVVNDAIVIRPMMYLALSYDHRIIDGREAVLFLVKIKEMLENPERMLLEL